MRVCRCEEIRGVTRSEQMPRRAELTCPLRKLPLHATFQYITVLPMGARHPGQRFSVVPIPIHRGLFSGASHDEDGRYSLPGNNGMCPCVAASYD
jgi:hypothetical protein